MRIIAPVILLLLIPVMSASSQEVAPSPNDGKSLGKGAVYAKILLPRKAPAEAEQPTVESWIARRLKRRGATELRAVTGWVRLAEEGEEVTHVWDATIDGKLNGCPVVGRCDRNPNGIVRVTLSGWSPLGASVKGGSLLAEIGSRTIAVVDTGRVDGAKSYVALLYAPTP